MTDTFDFATFAAGMKKQGFDLAVKQVWDPLTTVEEHTRAFQAKALVVQGEMWLTVNGRTQHLLPGETFELTAHQPHSERYGAEGATYWVGPRNVRTTGYGLAVSGVLQSLRSHWLPYHANDSDGDLMLPGSAPIASRLYREPHSNEAPDTREGRVELLRCWRPASCVHAHDDWNVGLGPGDGYITGGILAVVPGLVTYDPTSGESGAQTISSGLATNQPFGEDASRCL